VERGSENSGSEAIRVEEVDEDEVLARCRECGNTEVFRVTTQTIYSVMVMQRTVSSCEKDQETDVGVICDACKSLNIKVYQDFWRRFWERK